MLKKIKTTYRCAISALSIAAILTGCETKQEPQKPLADRLDDIFEKAEVQALNMAETLTDDSLTLPRSYEHGKLTTSGPEWWTSGFFPGTLWLIYEQTQNPKTLEMAKEFTHRVKNEQYTTNNHDIGFMMYCSYGNGLRITKDSTYVPILVQSAKSLSTRFRDKTGVIRSWDQFQDVWQYPVIIDNMMNLELLFWATKATGDKRFYDIATTHANTTMCEHFRPDYSCYHVVSYDTISGKPHAKQTNQGCADESAWARGQAWALYGYTMSFRETNDSTYLNQAINVAEFLLNHPRMPKDGIPYWDFDAPDIPNVPRDASSAAVIASALLELCQYTDTEKAQKYFDFAEKELEVLSSDEYTAKEGENGNFILMHSVGNMPINSEIDAPLTYADYYYIEALGRYKNIYKEFKK